MDGMVSYQLCTYQGSGHKSDPLRAQYTAQYRAGRAHVAGATWDERFACLRELLGDLPPEGWHMTVGNVELCEFYSPDPPPFGRRIVLRLADESGQA